MHSRTLALAIAVTLGLASQAARADSVSPLPSRTCDTEVAQLKAELAAIRDKLAGLETRVDGQPAARRAGVMAAHDAQARPPAAAAALSRRADGLDKLVDDTRLSGKLYFDFSHVDQRDSPGGRTAASGTGLDVKRFYLGVDHRFDDIWSANLTTDFNYVANDGATNLFVKKAYVQGRFDRAFALRVGAADLPWVPFVENAYGFRYVENTLIDRLKFGTSADWGLHAFGAAAGRDGFGYAVSVVNGGGYRNPSRSKGVDVEARVGFMPVAGLTVALGGYSGHLGKETATAPADHTAQRGDVLVAYAGPRFRAGGEYFTARNWNAVMTPRSDRADGWSAWASVALTDELAVFARYDRARLSRDLDRRATDVYANFGVQYQLCKGFKLAGVWKHERGVKSVVAPLAAARTVRTDEVGVFGEVAF